jgi:hypothetical protein
MRKKSFRLFLVMRVRRKQSKSAFLDVIRLTGVALR